ncbi:aldehyde dehydrogenase family protein, partial [bacterium]|nr:aldehyde dehydrogenase family protein [bacterium]
MEESNKSSSENERLEVLKTYKMYIDGKFPRTESARYYQPVANDSSLGNVCLASRKDVRNAVVAARSAQAAWARRTAYNRAQILYRIAEMLEGRSQQFMDELVRQGVASEAAEFQVAESIDRLIYYAGWCDKYQQIFSTVNPVASSHFNFSTLEPVGVVFAVASQACPLLGLVSLIAPVIASGNTCVVLDLLNVPKLGPKKCAALFNELGIQSLDQLKAACEAQQVRLLSGFGAKTEEAILQGISIAVLANERILWAHADKIAKDLEIHMSSCSAIRQIEFA